MSEIDERQEQVLLGVVLPGDPAQALYRQEYPDAEALDAQVQADAVDTTPQDREARPFEDAHGRAVMALEMTRERLRELRAQRTCIADQIRQLVEDEDLLQRMTRVRRGQRGPRRPETDT